MGIASGVFWIVFGIGYVIYLSFKERPRETLCGAALFVILGVALSSWVFIFHSILDYDVTAAIVFMAISVMVMVAWLYVAFRKDAVKREEVKDKYQQALEIARNEPIDEEQLKKFEQVFWARPCPTGMYQSDKSNYRRSKDKSGFRDLIIKDYIENFRVYQVMTTLDSRARANR